MLASMSKGKIRGTTEICGDCGALDPTWASLNKGILLCDECCSIHRSLGRHISQVKSLKKGSWSPTLLQMVHTLNNSGVNSIWEHSLSDPCHGKLSRRKPQPKDPIHPAKADFIRAKHQMLAFVLRPAKDDTLLTEDDLNKQLHSSVRTANLETSLRLLSQGADPNYFHEEKGTTPLHVAAKAGQILQAELLIVYGADPGALSSQGKTPAEIARSLGHKELADRLCESVYELTDRLAYFLCSRKPDHQNGQHFIIPEMSDTLDITELGKIARKKLQKLPNHLFEELAMDVYDEVDRRETELICGSINQPGSSLNVVRCAVPFLPVNPELSSTRNQGRQKLARFNARELATLIIDILSDVKRRQSPVTASLYLPQDNKDSFVSTSVKSPLLKVDSVQYRKSEISDDEPLYDLVASDDDYITAEEIARLAALTDAKVRESRVKVTESDNKVNNKQTTPVLNGPHAEKTEVASNSLASIDNLLQEQLRKQLLESELKLSELRTEINILQSTVQNLTQENAELRGFIQRSGLIYPNVSSTSSCSSSLPNGSETETEPEYTTASEVKSSRMSGQRPVSMYEPRDALMNRGVFTTVNINKWDKNQRRDINEYDCPSNVIRPVMTQSLYQNSVTSREKLPLPEDVKRRTDQVTRCIQELWSSMQEPAKNDGVFIPCAEKIEQAVSELTTVFPSNTSEENLRLTLSSLKESTTRLRTDCHDLQQHAGESGCRSHYLQQVRSSAYDIAKATKQLVTKYGV